MKRFFTLLLLSIFVSLNGFGQNYVNYNKDTRWFIGLNGGATWTTKTEVPYQIRGGYGLTFGKSFGMEPDKVFSWDWRVRFLHAQVQGQAKEKYNLDSTSMSTITDLYGESTLNEYKDSIGYFIPNYRSDLLRGSIELVLNTNRLRQRTGWNLSVFGGLGLTGYHTATNIKNEFGQIYDYNTAGNFSKSNLTKFQDGTYETDLNGTFADYELEFMPSFGFGISRQLLPGIAFGIEHKMTWTRMDDFDGMPNTFDGLASPENDIYHYTSATLKFHLFNGRRNVDPVPDVDVFDQDETDIDDFDGPPVVTDPPARKKPIVEIYDPASSPFTTENNTFRLKANVYYVDGKANITFKQDGNLNTNFSYNPTTDKFESNVVLHPGQNLFEITGQNEAGSDYEATIIIYQEEVETINPPIVTITNPPYTPYTVNSPIFGLVSTVLNVDSKAQIQVYFNGVVYNSFSYNLASKILNASLNLKEGTNTVTVTATNAAGSDSKTVQIIYEKPITAQPPIVDFINPGVDPFYTSTGSINIRATALNVLTKSNVLVKVNGNIITSFTFNAGTKEINFPTALIEGANIVEITGTNEVGSDYATTTIIYTRPETPQPPIVTFIDPSANPITVYSNAYNVTAKVEYVESASDITLKINGLVSTYFTYSTSSDLMNFTTSLVEGSNVIEIKGVNVHGEDVESTTIIYKKTIPQAPPVVNITYPAIDNQVFGTPNITLVANVLNVNDAANISVSVNGVSTYAFTYNTFTKVLNLPLVLNEGANTVQITGVNVAGSDTDSRVIIYEKPIVPAPPTVVFVNPPSSPHLVAVPSFSVKANTTNIYDKSQISLKQNGALIPDVAYTLTAGNQIIFNATLIAGNNIFEVLVENEDGTDEDLVIVNYTKDDAPCIIPTVGYIHPVPYSTVSDPAVTIDAQINNHSPGTTVELKLNGVSKGYMTYNEGTSIASKSILLNEGSNAINVVVTNACGTNQATFTLIYIAPDAPCYDPTIEASGPTSVSTLAETISLTANSSHVSNLDELSVLLNGVSIPFTFDAGTGSIAIPSASLSLGTNSIVITATTNCGTAVLVYTITRDECTLPTISGLNPVSGASVETSSIVFTANVLNVVSEDIVLLLNGVSQTFTYNADSKVLTAGLNLSVGSNTIVLTAINACGDATKTNTIIRKIPCQSIITNLIVPATNTITVTNDSYDVKLNATSLTSVEQITATLNGGTVTPVFDPVTGNISLNGLMLNDGVNTVVVNMVNECSTSTITYTITYDGCETPVVYFNGIISPEMVVSESSYSLSATISNVSNPSEITLKVNGVITDFTFNAVTHLLTSSLILDEGLNTLEITVDGCEFVKASTSIIYDVPCPIISHTLMLPTTTTKTVVESEYAITLSTYGVASAEEISVTQNGAVIPFTFNAMTKIISISGINLIDGLNSILVSLNNSCSSDVISYQITYNGCVPPVITLGDNPTEVTEIIYTYEANISNIDNPAVISFLVNGAPTEFVFDPITGSFEATLTLDSAIPSNIVLTVEGCETVSESLLVTYTRPCLPITYTLGSPATLTNEVIEDTYAINLIVLNASSIVVTVNGTTKPFTYLDNLLSINGIALIDGVNTITVNATNACSSESIVYTITKDDCNTPTIDLSENLVSSTSVLMPFKAIFENVESADEIEVLFNGTAIEFDFNVETGVLTAMVTLLEGENTFVVNVNTCASATASLTASYIVPCSPVTYSYLVPNTPFSTSDTEITSLSVSVTNVTDPATIAVTLNGEVVPHTFSSNVISLVGIALVDGENNILVSFGNDCSEESLAYTINYDACVSPPAITINGLSDGMTMEEGEFIYYASVFNIDDAGDIVLKLNGTAIPFEFNAVSALVSATINLSDGSNVIELIANGCETVSESITLSYEEPCAAPTYTRVMPAGTTVDVESDTYTVSLTANNVTSEQISVTLNGESIPFTFAGGSLVIEVELSESINTLQVNLITDCGSESISYALNYIPVEVDCTPIISTDFAEDHLSVAVTSNKELINVMLNLADGSTQLITDLAGLSGTFEATGIHAGNCIIGVWVRSGCNLSAAGEPYGDYIINTNWGGKCLVPEPCKDINYSLVAPASQSAVSKSELYNIVLIANNLEDVDNVSVLLNGVKANFTLNDNKITIPTLKLITGNNVVQVNLRNSCSAKKIVYTISYVPAIKVEKGEKEKGESGAIKLDGGSENIKDGGFGSGVKVQMPAPVFTPISPSKTSSTVTSANLPLKFKVDNVSSKADITLVVNGVKVTNFNYSSGSKYVNTVVKLNKGVNLIKVTANNGKAADITYYVTYSEPVQKPIQNQGGNGSNNNDVGVVKQVAPPSFQRISPTSSSYLSRTNSAILKLKILNISSKNDVKLEVNGVRTTGFSYNSSNQTLVATLRLKEGDNRVKVTATNANKSVAIDYVFRYTPKEEKPVVKDIPGNVVKPKVDPKPVFKAIDPSTTNTTVKSEMVTLKLMVVNVSSVKDFNISLNGASLTSYTFNANTKELVVSAKVKPGTNQLKINAKNGSQSATITYTIKYVEQKSIAKPGAAQPGNGGLGSPSNSGSRRQ